MQEKHMHACTVCLKLFHSSIIQNSKTWELHKCPVTGVRIIVCDICVHESSYSCEMDEPQLMRQLRALRKTIEVKIFLKLKKDYVY